MTRPVITLTTDFGTESYYVGAVRGALLRECPEAVLVDITHRVPAYSVLQGAFILEQACRTFPAGTVHLAVVDPGVGGPRRGLIVDTPSARFVGPDNGLFTPFLEEAIAIHAIRVEAFPEASTTFHGRDLFAPVAARLAAGRAPETLGERITDPVRLSLPLPERKDKLVLGEILGSDRFGNLITNLRAHDVGAAGEPVEIMTGGHRISGVARTYGDAPAGVPIALIGSSGFLEVAVVRGNAQAVLGVHVGDRVVVRRP